jgi:hypothetical protein
MTTSEGKKDFPSYVYNAKTYIFGASTGGELNINYIGVSS